MDPERVQPALRGGLWLSAGAFVLALLARTWPFTFHVFRPGLIALYGDSDPYYHLRRIQLATAHFPVVPDFDPWLDFPHGAYAIWSPLFDWLPAAFSKLTGVDPTLVAVFWPAFLGGCVAVVLHRFLRRLVGDAWCVPALLLYCLLPGPVLIAALGRVDHHVAEVLLQLSSYLLCARLLDAIEAEGAVRSRALALGAVMGAALLTWAGALLFLCVPAAVLCLAAVSGGPRARSEAFASAAALAFGCAALLVAPVALLNLMRGRAAFASVHLSLLHVALCVVAAVAPKVLAYLVAGLRARSVRAWVGAAAMLSLPWLVPGLRDGLMDGLSFVTRDQSAWLTEIAEFQPLWHQAAWETSYHSFGYGEVLLVLPTLLFGWHAWRERHPTVWLTFGWIAHATALGYAQFRFSNYAGPVVAAAPALCWVLAARGSSAVAGYARIVAAALFLATLPALQYWQPLVPGGDAPHVAYPQLRFPVFDMLRRFERASPDAGDPLDVRAVPAYGVLAPWDLGHWIVSIAKRPVVATPFGTHLGGQGYADAERFYRSIDDENSALQLLASRKCKYVITDAPAPGATRYERFAYHLHQSDGASTDRFAGSGRFRRRLATMQLMVAGQPGYKIFEVVPGAMLKFSGVTAKQLWVRTRVPSDVGPFDYARRATDHAGFEVRVAHPGEYTILADGAELGRVTVPEGSVMKGTTVTLRSGAPSP